MKLHLIHHLPIVIFCVLIFADMSSAQPPRGIVKGVVTTSNKGVTVGSPATITLTKKDRTGYPQTIVTKKDGSFYFNAEFGDYELKTKSGCMTGKDDLQINSTAPVNVNINLIYENCKEKAAAEKLVWSEFDKEKPDSQGTLNDIEKANIVNLIFGEMLGSESEWVTSFYGNREIMVSTENIRPEWIKAVTNLQIVFLSSQEIKARTNRKVDYTYFLFHNWTKKSSGISVGLSRITAIGKRSKIVFICTNGSTVAYMYIQNSGKLIKRIF